MLTVGEGVFTALMLLAWLWSVAWAYYLGAAAERRKHLKSLMDAQLMDAQDRMAHQQIIWFTPARGFHADLRRMN